MKKINKEIAKLLGFTAYNFKINGKISDIIAYHYPEKYKHLQTSTPETTLPDFEKIINHFTNKSWFDIPRDF